MSSQVKPLPKLNLNGSCHCGAIHFVAKGVDLNKISKCNCSICVKDGSIMTKIPGDSLLLREEDGTTAIFSYKDNLDGHDSQMRNVNLQTYRFNFDNPSLMIFRHFCNKCGVPVFATAYAEGHGSMASLNVNALELEGEGIDRKDITKAEKLIYYNGRVDVMQSQEGEPSSHGCW